MGEALAAPVHLSSGMGMGMGMGMGEALAAPVHLSCRLRITHQTMALYSLLRARGGMEAHYGITAIKEGVNPGFLVAIHL